MACWDLLSDRDIATSCPWLPFSNKKHSREHLSYFNCALVSYQPLMSITLLSEMAVHRKVAPSQSGIIKEG